MSFILIVFVTAGALSQSDSMALTNVPGFTDIQQCEAAGKAAVKAFGTGFKRAEFVCVAQKK